MADTLSTLITKVQNQLGDDGTAFPTATCTGAIREALREFNFKAPLYKTAEVAVVNGQKAYDLSAITGLVQVQSVHLEMPNELDMPLSFDPYVDNTKQYIRLRNARASGTLLVRYAFPHTINGLDGAVTSTIDAYFDQTIVDGACHHACISRARSRSEANNLNKSLVEHLERLAKLYRLSFDAGLKLASQRRAPTGEPDTSAWTLDTHRDF